jgi:putative tricarboxylic transport membrane protein
MGPKGMSPDQVAYWEGVLRQVAQSEALREYADKNQWLLEFKGAADTRKWLDEEYALLKVAMTELGLARPPQ